MKVLLINNFHYRKGGSETVYFNTAELLKINGHEVRFFSFDDIEAEHDGNEILISRAGTKLRSLFSYFDNRVAAKRLNELLNEFKPDVAHVHLIWGGMSSSILPVLKKHHVHIVHTAHDYRLICPAYTFRNGKGEICEKCKDGRYSHCLVGRCAKGNLLNSFVMACEMYFRQAFRNPAKYLDGIIFVSEFARRIHIDSNPSFSKVRNIVLHNFTDVEYRPKAYRGNYFLYMGRISAEKGVATLVDAFSTRLDWKLKIVGDGPERAGIEDVVRRRGLPNIEFLGYRTGSELKELLLKSSFVVVPSEWYENNPMSIIEAFANAKPVIGSNIGGIPELVSISGAGLLFDPFDVQSLIGALCTAASLSDKQYDALCCKAVTFANTDSSSQEYVGKLMEFYSQVIDFAKKSD